MHARPLLVLASAFLLGPTCVHGQGSAKAATCVVSFDLEDGTFPAGWTNQTVERQDAQGNGLGEFVEAWTVGNAQEANGGGFFPVPDRPTGNRFLMANDDAAPCNCAMGEVALTSPVIDLTGRAGMALQLRVFHEQTLGAGPAFLDAFDGTEWQVLLEIPAVEGEWQDLFLDLSAYDGNPGFRFRFRWSDGNVWSSGIAIDDICLMDRLPSDLSILQLFTHDPGRSAFDSSVRSLRYRTLPAEQADSVTAAVEVMNQGQLPIAAFDLALTLTQAAGTVQADLTGLSALAPGERRLVVLPTLPLTAEVGPVDLTVQATVSGTDGDLTDNTATATFTLTGDGWANGYGEMGCDEGAFDGSLGGTDPWVVAQRMEIVTPGSVAQGISAVIGGDAAGGQVVRAILFDHELAFVDTSTRHTLTPEDIQRGVNGEPLFLPLASAPSLEPGDYFVGFQRLENEVTTTLSVGTSGNGPLGASVLLTGTTFVVNYLERTPMVRLHLSAFGVGMEEGTMAGTSPLQVFPNPVVNNVVVTLDLATGGPVRMDLQDASGRLAQSLWQGTLPTGEQRFTLPLERIPNGIYLLTVRTGTDILTQRIIVAR